MRRFLATALIIGLGSSAAAEPTQPKPAPRPAPPPSPSPTPKPVPAPVRPAPKPEPPSSPAPPPPAPKPVEPRPVEPRPVPEPKPDPAKPAEPPKSSAPTAPALASPTLGATDPARSSLDLSPSRVVLELGNTAGGSRKERGPALSLGDDRDWKVQAAQVGAMVGLFAGLAALCGSGACAEAMPTGGFLPDFLRSREGPTVDLSPPRPLRQAR